MLCKNKVIDRQVERLHVSACGMPEWVIVGATVAAHEAMD